MGAVAITSQKQPAGSSAEPTPETMERIDFARQQEVETELQQVKITMEKLEESKDLEMNEIRHRVEKRLLMKHITELKDSVRSSELTINNLKKDREERMENQKQLQEELETLRRINNKLENKYETLMRYAVKVQTELDLLTVANDKLDTYWKSKMKDCEEEKEILVFRNQELQRELAEIKTNLPVELQRLKIAKDNLNNHWESKMKELEQENKILVIANQQLQEELQEMKTILPVELQRLKIAKDNLNNHWESKMKELEQENKIVVIANQQLQKELVEIKTNLPVELQRLEIAKDNLNNHWESKIKELEQGNKILVIANQQLQKELQEMKTNIKVPNLQLDGTNSQPQQDHQCARDTFDDGKTSLNNFQFIRRLGEGAFGTVVLAKGKLLGGPEELYAIKALKKRGIDSSNICEIVTEKQALMLTTGHPYITTLYSCFQNKEHLFFVMEYLSGGDSGS